MSRKLWQSIVPVALCAFIASAAPAGAQVDNGESSLAAGEERESLRPKEFGADNNIATIPSSAFLPYDSSVTYVYANAGYRSRTAGSNFFDAPIQLPAGALVTGVELEACDDSAAAEITMFFFECGNSPTSACSSVATAATGIAGVPGCNYFFAAMPGGFTVNNFVSSYFLRVSDPDGLATTRFRGARLFWRRQVSPAPATATFSDVPTTHSQFRFIEALADAGITGGCAAGQYCPDAPLTRGQMAVFLSVALGLHWPN